MQECACNEASVLAGSCEQGAKYAFSCRRMEVFWIICRAKRLCWYAQRQNKGLKMPSRNIFVSEMFNFGHEIRDYPLNHKIIMFSSRQMRSAGSARLFTSQRTHTHTHTHTSRNTRTAPALFQRTLGRKCVTPSHSNECLLPRARLKPAAASCQDVSPTPGFRSR